MFNNQNFDGKVLVSTPNPNIQGLQNNFPVNYQQAKNSNINII